MGFLNELAAIVGLAIAVALIALSEKNATRTRGKNIPAHILYAIVVVLCFFLLPMEAKDTIFTPLAVVIVGTLYPVYESIVAVCTIDEEDDTTWLTYWVAQGVVSFSTQWVDGLGEAVSTSWDMFQFFFYIWLLLPQTDGATLISDIFLLPVVAPLIQPIVKKTEGIINKIVMALTNAAHLAVVWIVFVILPSGLKRAIWILIATAYPLGSSLISITTPEVSDDTFWLTYWSCFGILYLIVDFLETFLGFIPGFYTLAIVVTVYLMLPLFRGADQVFRNILVPLAGLQEMLVHKDAEEVKNAVLRDLPPERRAAVMKSIAESFEKSAKEHPNEPAASAPPVSPDGYTQIV